MARTHRLIARAARLWWAIRRPRTLGVRALVLDGEERVALVKHTYLPNWYLPGGGVKRRERFADALARELREEIGLTEFRLDRMLGIYRNGSEGKDDHVVIYVVRIRTATADIRPADALEIEAAGWFALDRLPEDISPASLRRIEEYRRGETGAGDW
ncbi:NUDIX domain-containing protein [Sphingomonas sp. CGMCC 1.13654]|uniref:NUDIX domain-containing protein n=1 Tax=Sphingomonas chungangi TaxID=2683589 RepID=A0A838L1F5_9SPHN|nr:NUDIX domain-containing protein [Sphingomonas chungangi]MBA2933191.1 NUDIX domain-containing protein [Sphingomonas chungangi]MVW57863.1 NUDIX domain-containing protein [Sphingomonas chungangi]